MSLFESYELIRFPGNNTTRQTPCEIVSAQVTWILRYGSWRYLITNTIHSTQASKVSDHYPIEMQLLSKSKYGSTFLLLSSRMANQNENL